jgi:hypothetical protein
LERGALRNGVVGAAARAQDGSMTGKSSTLVFSLFLLSQVSSAAMAGQASSAKALSLEETQALLVSRISEQWQVDANEIRVSEAEARTWPDAGLGCAGMRRRLGPAPVPGYRFVLVLGDERLTFHADTHGTIRRCDAPGKPLEPIAN